MPSPMKPPSPRASEPPDPCADSAAVLRRLRWRARRGLLENDLVIGRFLDLHGRSLGAAEAAVLGRLLELPDQTLLELLLARQEPAGELDGPAVRALLAALRAVRLQSAPAGSGGQPAAGATSRPAATPRPAGA